VGRESWRWHQQEKAGMRLGFSSELSAISHQLPDPSSPQDGQELTADKLTAES